MRVSSQLDVVYYGCQREAGHYFFLHDNGTPQRRCDFLPDEITKDYHVDGGYVPKSGQQGEAALHHVDGWTVVAFADYGVDHRPGSHSTFIVRGVMGFDEAVAASREKFPGVWARYRFPIILSEGG